MLVMITAKDGTRNIDKTEDKGMTTERHYSSAPGPGILFGLPP